MTVTRHVTFNGRFKCGSGAQSEWGWVDANGVEWDDEYDDDPREPLFTWANRTGELVMEDMCESECTAQCPANSCWCVESQVTAIIEASQTGAPDWVYDRIRQISDERADYESKIRNKKAILESLPTEEELRDEYFSANEELTDAFDRALKKHKDYERENPDKVLTGSARCNEFGEFLVREETNELGEKLDRAENKMDEVNQIRNSNMNEISEFESNIEKLDNETYDLQREYPDAFM